MHGFIQSYLLQHHSQLCLRSVSIPVSQGYQPPLLHEQEHEASYAFCQTFTPSCQHTWQLAHATLIPLTTVGGQPTATTSSLHSGTEALAFYVGLNLSRLSPESLPPTIPYNQDHQSNSCSTAPSLVSSHPPHLPRLMTQAT